MGYAFPRVSGTHASIRPWGSPAVPVTHLSMAAATCSQPVSVPAASTASACGGAGAPETAADAECFGGHSHPGDAASRLDSVESVRVAREDAAAAEAVSPATLDLEHESASVADVNEDSKVDPSLSLDVPEHAPRLTHAKLSWSDIMRGDIIDAADEPVDAGVEALPPLPDDRPPSAREKPEKIGLGARLLSCWTCDGKSLSCLRSAPGSGRPREAR